MGLVALEARPGTGIVDDELAGNGKSDGLLLEKPEPSQGNGEVKTNELPIYEVCIADGITQKEVDNLNWLWFDRTEIDTRISWSFGNLINEHTYKSSVWGWLNRSNDQEKVTARFAFMQVISDYEFYHSTNGPKSELIITVIDGPYKDDVMENLQRSTIARKLTDRNGKLLFPSSQPSQLLTPSRVVA